MPAEPIDDQRALALLNAVAVDSTPTAVEAFDDFFYEHIIAYIRRRHRSLGAEVARRKGLPANPAPPVDRDRLEEACHIAANITLDRARARAATFDPSRGRVATWIYAAAAFAYVEVAKQFFKEQSELLTDVEARAAQDRPSTSPLDDPAAFVASQDYIDNLFLALTDDERMAFALHTSDGYTYAEIAEQILGSADQTKRVDYLLQQARIKLRARYAELQGNDGAYPDPYEDPS